MAFSDLQLGLVCAGGAAVVALIGYNLWQERRARKHAEQLFRPSERDALLDAELVEAIPPAPGGRMEPTTFVTSFENSSGQDDIDMAPRVQPTARARTAATRAAQPVLPADSQAIDCVVTVEAPAGIAAASLFTAQQALLAGFSKPLRWFGWDDSANQWTELDARSPGNLNRATAALQLADRRGAVSDVDLMRFYDQMQRLCDQFLAVPRLPARNEVLERANELDHFCSDVDIQIAINVAAKEGSFPGTKIRGLAEAAGMILLADGAYHAQDEEGRTLYTLSNQEAASFSAEQLRNLYTTGVTVALDVPRAPDPVASFDKMVSFAQKLSAALNGVLVDDNRVLLSERSISLIRGQIAQFDQQMERQGIPAGSEVALRLFR